ncbi:MAG: PCRF domain-containing protein, partial [Desulfobacula sp.]|nr:PCRF domain-containing protein [Desulfobacula sp.]
MIEKLKGIEERFIKLEQLLSDPVVISDQKKYQSYLIEHGELNKIVPMFRKYEGLLEERKEAKELLKDIDLEIRAMAKEEIPGLDSKIEAVKSQLNILLMPKDPRDDKNVLLEIRAGTGGEEAGIFTGDLFRMYSRYTESKNWTLEIVEKNDSSSGGFKEIVFLVRGKGAFSSFKYESG